MASGSLVRAGAQTLELPGLKEVVRKDANIEKDGGWPSGRQPTPYSLRPNLGYRLIIFLGIWLKGIVLA